MRFAPVILVVLSALAVVSGGQSSSKPVQVDEMTPGSEPIQVGEGTLGAMFRQYSELSVKYAKLAEQAPPSEKESHEKQAHAYKLEAFRASSALHGKDVRRQPDPDDPRSGKIHKEAAQYHRDKAKLVVEQGAARVKEEEDPLSKLRIEAISHAHASRHEEYAKQHEDMYQKYRDRKAIESKEKMDRVAQWIEGNKKQKKKKKQNKSARR